MILSKLENVKKTSSGWTARCPAHEDNRSSLSVSIGDDGRTLIHCHVGCTPEAIVNKLGLAMRDLMPNSNGNGKQGATAKPKINGRGNISTTYDYRSEDGDLLYQVCRMIPKDFRQRKPKDGGGWNWTIGDVRRVPFRLPELISADPAETVYIPEGEKDVESLVRFGFVATCNSGGADSGKGEKWRPEFAQYFRDRRVVILPDKDTPGRKHGNQVATALYGSAAEIKVVELPGPGKDVSDWLGVIGSPPGLRQLVEAAPIWTPETAPPTIGSTITAKPILSWKPFPLDALPQPIRTYVRKASSAMGVDSSYITTALLAALAGAIGNSRLILLKKGWVEPSVLWGVLVGDSGTMKSPAIDAATKHVRQRQATAIEIYRKAMEEYERDLEQYKADLEKWKRGGKNKGEPMPPELVKPICDRFTCSDVTVEGLAILLADAWRGLLLVRDELAGWVASFDQYKNGHGSDSAHWLTIYGARDLLVDRKTSDRKMVHVRRAAVSICGGIQPGTLSRVLGDKHFENGLAARLLLAMPPRQPKQWTETEIDDSLDQKIGRLFDAVYRLEPKQDDNGQPEPITLGLSASGKAAWITFYNEHAERQADATGEQAAALSKIEGAAARLALVVHCVREAAGDRTASDQIDDRDVGSGVAIARWYADEAERVYSVLRESDDGRLQRQVVELISRKGGSITANDLRRRSRHFATTEDAEEFLVGLVKAGAGTWVEVQHEGAGRPTQEFHLSESVSVSQIQGNPMNTAISDTEDEESGVVGWSEFNDLDRSGVETLVSEIPPKHEENTISDTDTEETVGDECKQCGSLELWWDVLDEPHCMICEPMDRAERLRRQAERLRRRLTATGGRGG